MGGIDIKLTRKDGNTQVDITFTIIGLTYVDNIIEIDPLYMDSGDVLTIIYNIHINGYMGEKLTSSIPVKFQYKFNIDKPMLVKFIRFTRLHKQGKIQIYEELPKGMYKPKNFDAEMIE